MDILNTKAILALGISGAMSVGSALAEVSDAESNSSSPIIAISSPDLRVTVYDGIATLIGTAGSQDEAALAEQQILAVNGVEHVINLITWG